MEFLDIDLATWSMILFLIQVIFYTAMTLIFFGGQGNKALYAFIIITFTVNQVSFLIYGIDTDQIGFVLTVIFQFFLILLTQIYLNNTAKEMMEDEN